MHTSQTPALGSNDVVTIAHLSDLHFSEHAAKATQDACHSVAHLVDLKRALHSQKFDRLLVSGDLSDRGNSDALLRAYDYLFGEYSVGDGQKVGLGLDPSRVHLVPGNHDAFNTNMNGDTLKRWQRSLVNYNSAFPQHHLPAKGCGYAWIDQGDWGVYVAFADTCFIGDPVLEKEGTLTRLFDAIAKGKVAKLQARQLLKWFDLGTRGQLPQPGVAGNVPAAKFAASFKILMMHHYVFEPVNCRSDYLMRLCDRHNVFRNIALCNFDVLLCGHKHIPDFSEHTYGYHLERRGKRRYLINLFRRTIGISSLPIQFRDANGKQFPRRLSWIAQGLLKTLRMRAPGDIDVECGQLVNILMKGLENPASLRSEVRSMMRQLALSSEAFSLTTREVKKTRTSSHEAYRAAAEEVDRSARGVREGHRSSQDQAICPGYGRFRV